MAHLEWGVTMKQIPDTHMIDSGQAGATRKPALRVVNMGICGGRDDAVVGRSLGVSTEVLRSAQFKVSCLGSILLKALSCLLQHGQDELEKNWLLCDELTVKSSKQSKKMGSRAVGEMASRPYSGQGRTSDLETLARTQSSDRCHVVC